MLPPQKVAVIGCGIAGASFALLASRQGHQIHLFEQSQRVGPLGAGVLLQPSGQKILTQLGLLQKVTQNAEIIQEIHAVTHRGRDLIRLNYNNHHPQSFAYGLHRGDLFTILHNELIQAGVNLHLGIEMQSCSSTNILTDQSQKNHGPYDLVVVADGSKSRLRQTSGIPHHCHEYPHGALWAVGQCSSIRNKLWQVTQSTRRLCGLLPMGQSRCSLFWGLHCDEYHHLQQSNNWDNWKKEVLNLAPPAAELLEKLDPPQGLTFTTFRHITMKSWTTNKMVFIGDAAHATSPHLGQGINLALLDAATLATALQTEPTIPAALHTYTTLRQCQLRYYSIVTRLLTPFFQSNSRLHAVARDIALPQMPRIPPLRNVMLKTLRGEMCLQSQP